MSTAAERIVIAGCGDLGTALGLRLSERGHEVFGLRRRPDSLPAPLRTLTGDLIAPRLDTLPRDIDLLYYLATPGAYEDQAYRATYVHGLQNLLGALGGKRPRRLIFVSSTSVYGQVSGEWVDEQSPAEPGGFSGSRLLEGEAVARAAPFPATVIRFGGIYGPGRTRMLRKVRAGEACCDSPPQHTNRIHREDCIGILEHLASPAIDAGLYLGVDDTPCTQCELMDYLAAQMGLAKPQRVAGPAGGLRGSNKRVRNDKLKASGYRFIYPSYREGYAAMLAEETPR